MKQEPLVSVILPVYNAEEYVSQAIQSIVDQTLANFELIVIDDASTDKSLDIIKSFNDPRIKVLMHQENKGYPHATIYGLSHAKGKYIARMDADDFSAPSRLMKQIHLLENHEGFIFVGSRRFWITPKGKYFFPEPIRNKEWLVETREDLMSGKRYFTDPSVTARKEDIERVGGYRHYQRSGMDVDLWLRLFETGKNAGTLTEPLYGRRLIPGAITFSPQTTALNKIPRMLAQERFEKGSDAVMRKEEIRFTITPQMIKESHIWRISALWNSAIRCVDADDFSGSLQFAKVAILIGYSNRVSFRWATKYCAKLLLKIFRWV